MSGSKTAAPASAETESERGIVENLGGPLNTKDKKKNANAQPKSWRDRIQVHPDADKMPQYPADVDAIAADIKRRGLMHRVVVMWGNPTKRHTDGTLDWDSCPMILLDGRNRLDALEKLGWELFDRSGRL